MGINRFITKMGIRMLDDLADLEFGMVLEDAMGVAHNWLSGLGFDVVTYDYSPVPLAHDGAFILPTVYSMRNAPEGMINLWCQDRLYDHDPVMDAARLVSQPFTWSHRGQQSIVMKRVLSKRHQPVVEYLLDTGLRRGITVPVRCPGGGLATFSAISLDNPTQQDLEQHVSAVGHLAHVLHDAVMPGFPAGALRTPHVVLTPRERQCMRLCASGLTTKEIAHHLERSVATVTLHLTSATKKLGARNRFHALTLAGYYRLLELDA